MTATSSSTPARLSQWFVPTLKEAPADAVAVSHRLLLRAGFVRPLGAGIYSYLPLARRVLAKVERIVRAEMDALGAQEVLLPALQPAEVWQASGRWDQLDATLFRLKDRREGDYALGMTHEEAMTSIARDELRSYRQLPQVWYQLQTKFRDEPRPRGGILRGREFLMKDAYSFDLDRAGLDVAYQAQSDAYDRIFARLGLEAIKVEAHSGAMGGRESTEFMVRTEAGEDHVAHCSACGYAANLEAATSRIASLVDEQASGPEPVRFATPGVVTIEALSREPYSVQPTRQLKTLVYVADGKPLIAVLRGDHALNEAKLEGLVGASQLRPAEPEEIVRLLGARPGSLGAVGVSSAMVYVDAALEHRFDMVTGANVDGFHLSGVDVDRDLLAHGAPLADLRTVAAGERCPRCSGGALELFKALEVGHIFKLGTRYSEAMGARVLAADGSEVPIVMGSYGIGVSRCVAAIVEAHHDDNGIRWPLSVAPFQVTVLTLAPELAEAAERLVADLAARGVEVLYDDRDERAGVKFKDADLIGVPIRIGVGKRGLADGGQVEWKLRADAQSELMTPGAVVERAVSLCAGGRAV